MGISLVIIIGILVCVVVHDFRLRKKFTNSDTWDQEEQQDTLAVKYSDIKELSEIQDMLIPRNRIILKNIELGSGHFGKIHKGLYILYKNAL